MCGITGLLDLTSHQPPTRDMLERMASAITHRGPDDDGEYGDQHIQLGMVRLSIIDLQGGHQPISNPEGTVWAVFNGEIFNYIELRQELEEKGHHFRTSSDTETIVHAYEEYGAAFAHKLNGMFAIAIWDTRKRLLFMARDRLGVKPLYYRLGPDGVVFASELKALLQDPDLRREVDPVAIHHRARVQSGVVARVVFDGEHTPARFAVVGQDDFVAVTRRSDRSASRGATTKEHATVDSGSSDPWLAPGFARVRLRIERLSFI